MVFRQFAKTLIIIIQLGFETNLYILYKNHIVTFVWLRFMVTSIESHAASIIFAMNDIFALHLHKHKCIYSSLVCILYLIEVFIEQLILQTRKTQLTVTYVIKKQCPFRCPVHSLFCIYALSDHYGNACCSWSMNVLFDR